MDVAQASLQPRRTGGRPAGRLGALLLAVVFLTVIGSSVGYLLGRHVRDVRAASSQRHTVTGTDTPAGKPCPDRTEQDAVHQFKSPGGLVQVLYIKTGGSEVWICRDTFDNLFYQGHRMSQAEQAGGAREPFTNTNSLILQTVKPEGSGYVAENIDSKHGNTRYHVSTAHLVIEYPDGHSDTEDVVAHDP